MEFVSAAASSGDLNALTAALSNLPALSEDEDEIAQRNLVLGEILFSTICKRSACNRIAFKDYPFDLNVCRRHMSCFKVLLDYGVALTYVTAAGLTPLHEAVKFDAHKPYVKLLTARGANTEAQDQIGRTPLHIACSDATTSIVCAKHLLKRGANVNPVDAYWETPLHYACRSGRDDLVSLLVDDFNAEIEVSGRDGETPLHASCHNNKRLCAQVLLRNGALTESLDDDDYTPLLSSILNLSPTCFDLLLLKGANRNARDLDGDTALHHACNSDNESNLLYVEFLIGSSSNKSDVNLQNNDGDTPLHFACSTGSLKCFELLLAAGANARIANNLGDTPLHDLVSASAAHIEFSIQLRMAKALMERVDLAVQNRLGQTVARAASTLPMRNLLRFPVIKQKAYRHRRRTVRKKHF